MGWSLWGRTGCSGRHVAGTGRANRVPGGTPSLCQTSLSWGGHAGQDPQSQPYPTPLRRYLCHLSLPTHLSPREPPENQLSAAGCYKPDTGVPGQGADPCWQITHCLFLPPPCLRPACASPPWEMGWRGARPCCAGGLLRLPGDRLGAELLLQMSGALYGLWASF